MEMEKNSYIRSEIQGWRGYGKISGGSHIQDEKYKKGNDNNRSKGDYWNFFCKVTWFEY